MFDKTGAQRAVGYYNYQGTEHRPKGDFYATPRSVLVPLLEREPFGKSILEPCCGDGAISKVLLEKGHTVLSRDLYDWGFGEIGKDFLKEPIIDVDAVITNPPFKYSLEFTRQALECTKVLRGKVAVLNRIQWLESEKRRRLFTSSPLAKVHVFSKRIPRMHRFDFHGTPGTTLLCFAWFVFDWQHQGPPQLAWL